MACRQLACLGFEDRVSCRREGSALEGSMLSGKRMAGPRGAGPPSFVLHDHMGVGFTRGH